jgi:hypothetical protein
MLLSSKRYEANWEEIASALKGPKHLVAGILVPSDLSLNCQELDAD